jgi:hypothetical protein
LAEIKFNEKKRKITTNLKLLSHKLNTAKTEKTKVNPPINIE